MVASQSGGNASIAVAAALGAAAGAIAATAVIRAQRSEPPAKTKSKDYLNAESALLTQLRAVRVVPVLAISDASKAVPLANAMIDGGLNILEVVFRTDAAADALRQISAAVPRAHLGAGTILTVEQAALAVEAGAKFIVSPGLNPAVVNWCLDRNIPVIPGIATPSEIEHAMRMGLTTLKFFPAETNGGPAAIKAICAPFSGLTIMPTGGVTEQNLKSYLSLKQVVAVGGTWMVPQDAVQNGERELLKSLAKSAKEAAQVVGLATEGTVATASIDRTARLWSIETGECLMSFLGHDDQVMSVKFSPDGQEVVTASTDSTVKLWSCETGKCIMTLVGHSGPVFTASFSPVGESLLTAGHDRTVKVWDVSSGSCMATLKKFDKTINGADYSPDGKLIATATDDPEVHLWSSETFACVCTIAGHEKKVFSVHFSSNGKLLLTASMDGTARISDVETGENKLIIKGHDDWLRCASFSPDGLKVVTASGDGTAKTWSAITGEPLLTLTGHEDWLRVALFSSDGRMIVTASKDGSARVWRADNGECVRKLDGHKAWVRSAAFAPTSRIRTRQFSEFA
eukprot:TRINITY_DN28017_c0_g1_i1.p1 TRINITY_DN28017_c0_g1~~TRINITY_DN28017_c0_g1_i1.p1  ORF type:complete len:585 (-),score=104.44 TRINITY_DN28017_c0_g1_i1:75-1787(-)